MPGVHYTQTGRGATAMQLFFSIYYLITGFHSLHVAIGIVILLVMARRTQRGDFDQDYHTPLEMTALYWHLVDLVWIFVFPLMYLIGRAG